MMALKFCSGGYGLKNTGENFNQKKEGRRGHRPSRNHL